MKDNTNETERQAGNILTLLPPGASVFHKHMSIFSKTGWLCQNLEDVSIGRGVILKWVSFFWVGNESEHGTNKSRVICPTAELLVNSRYRELNWKKKLAGFNEGNMIPL